jgi:hypothetical protein
VKIAPALFEVPGRQTDNSVSCLLSGRFICTQEILSLRKSLEVRKFYETVQVCCAKA